ncbi:MAG TPA: cobalamin-dependent protein [Gemmatimonadaceae bacterium]|nr:cobalamin-dependent protein [Gemmatimonadaceae bacterium]
MPTAAEAHHPIGVVAERTGLSPDVLRVWERRYHVVEPKRSPGGQRIYSDADIERLALLHRATRGGHGISHVASLGTAKLEELVRQVESSGVAVPLVSAGTGKPQIAIDQAVAFARALDPAGLELHLSRCAARFGIVGFNDAIAAPFLRVVGEAWHAGELTVAQEHFATAVTLRVVGQAAPLLTGSDTSPTIVIATLEGEQHSAGALMAAATAASDGWRVIYLGADLPAEEIAATATRSRARAVGISTVRPDRKPRAVAALRAIAKGIPPEATLFVGGARAAELARVVTGSGIVFVSSMAELQAKLGAARGG